MDDFQKLLLETFAEEVRETVQALETALLELEQAADQEAREDPFSVLARRAHNLKGAAGAAGVSAVQSLAHALEDGLIALRDTGEVPTPEVFDVLYVSVDTIRDLATTVGAPAATRLEDQLHALLEIQAGQPLEFADVAMPTDATEAIAPAPDPPPVPALAAADEPPRPPEPVPAPPTPPPAPPVVPPAAGASAGGEGGGGDGPDESLDGPVAEPEREPEPEPEPARPIAPDAAKQQPPSSNESADTAPSDASSTSRHEPRRTVRIAVDKLDTLMNQIGEIITVRKKSQARLMEVDDLRDTLTMTLREFQALRQLAERASVGTGTVLGDALDLFGSHLVAFDQRFGGFHRQSLSEASTEGLLTERLPEDIKRLRMRPFGTLEDIMKRTTRDAARHCDKRVKLDLVGMDSEADQVVLDVMRDPMMHLLRNCVDHGIERDRAAAGKPADGRITVKVEARGATLYITVADDGRGIDPAALREQVRRRNLMPTAQLEALTAKEVVDLIFLPGLSTANNLGVISGRGIGMDVVREVVHQHHGSIVVKTDPGEGTTFILTMPLTFATVQGIIVRVLGHDFALPMYALDRLIRLSRQDISYIEGSPTVSIEDQPVSIVPLSELLEVPPDLTRTNDAPEWETDAYAEAMLYGAVVRSGDKRIAFLVDDFVGESEMVVKEIPTSLGKVRNVSGATITWSGEVMVILNPGDLVDNALRKAAGRVEQDWGMDILPARRVLVCDDSVTTRTLEKNILVAAGYDVVTATNGLEALHIAEEQVFQLVVLDVDMPEMTGFELAARLRKMPSFRDVPIILVTSRDTDEDKRRGLAAGADAYITKQSFTQRTFLETVRRFLA